jgi:anti-sigma-K factor RskA
MNPNHLIDPAHDCDTIRELIPDYAFGLTDPEETRLVESSLSRCPEAARQLADFQCLQAEMRAAVPQIEPPAQLGERLMAAVAASAAPAKPRQHSFRRAWLAAAFALIALVITNIYWLMRVDDLARRQGESVSPIGGQPDNALVLTSTGDLRWARLLPSQQNSHSYAFLMWNAESEIGLLCVYGFPKPAVGQTYQLWLTRGEERTSAGTFRVDEEGQGALLFHVKASIDNYTWARITAEPDNGSDTPTGTVVVLGKLPA